MPRRTNPAKETVPPTISPQRATELLQAQLAHADEIKKLRFDDPKVAKWALTTKNILNGTFGKPDGELHENTAEFAHCTGGVLHMSMTDYDLQQYHIRRVENQKAILESIIEQLEILAPPAAQAAQYQYRFHPEVERVSGELYRDGHYKQAALEAYIRVIEEVKNRSGLNDDGNNLMGQAFGCDKHIPVIQFNRLQTDAERDEQKGIMFLFMGAVGLRNFKAHSNKLFDDPYRAHDYLALASLLMRLLKIATVNRAP